MKQTVEGESAGKVMVTHKSVYIYIYIFFIYYSSHKNLDIYILLISF
jgi:hypothetical protein